MIEGESKQLSKVELLSGLSDSETYLPKEKPTKFTLDSLKLNKYYQILKVRLKPGWFWETWLIKIQGFFLEMELGP